MPWFQGRSKTKAVQPGCCMYEQGWDTKSVWRNNFAQTLSLANHVNLITISNFSPMQFQANSFRVLPVAVQLPATFWFVAPMYLLLTGGLACSPAKTMTRRQPNDPPKQGHDSFFGRNLPIFLYFHHHDLIPNLESDQLLLQYIGKLRSYVQGRDWTV